MAHTAIEQAKGYVQEVIFLGTGTSGSLPDLNCLINSSSSCKTCKLSVTPEGCKNRRHNTSMLVRINHPDGRIRNVVIDCGKTFYQSALAVFVKHNVNSIDAVLITHGHTDAIVGLDDLWQWAKDDGTQIPVYADRQTYETISSMFPYLVDSQKATGSGDVPKHKFHVIDEPYNSFECQGMTFQPLRVEHGKYSNGSPYYFTGYRFDNISYVSDCSYIPEKTAALMKGSKLLVLDALQWTPHRSHFGFWQAVDEVRNLKPQRTLLTGFYHELEHSEVEKIGQKLEDEENIDIGPAHDGLKIEFKASNKKDNCQ